MNIQPVTIWANGQDQEATIFNLVLNNDNLSTSAYFSYTLSNINIILSSGFLSIEGQEYQDWDLSINANEWIYNWAAIQLNLVLIPETV